jgi:hypothetical protein
VAIGEAKIEEGKPDHLRTVIPRTAGDAKQGASA